MPGGYHRKVVPGWKNVQLGPFTGGMNTASDPSALKDNQLVDCLNLTQDLDGSLIVRPPIKLGANPPVSATRLRFLEGVTLSGVSAIIVASDTTVWSFNGVAFTQIATGLFAMAVSQYKEKAYIVVDPTSANSGGSWDGAAFVAIPTMAKGKSSTIWQERMWVVDGGFTAKLSFCAVADPTTWNVADFFNVSPGDGSRLRDLLVFNNNLLLFKEDSVFSLSYNTKPADAVINKISNNVGATGQNCVAQYQNIIYVYHQGGIYQMVNLNFVQINNVLQFNYDASAPSTRSDNVFMCMLGQRLIVRYFNTIYVYQTVTQTWSRWASADPQLHNFNSLVIWPQNALPDVIDRFFAGSTLANSNNYFQINDGWTTVDTESVPINISILTKDYDIGLSWKFKRLFFWGADVLTNRAASGVATPIIFNFTPSWGDLKNQTWDSLNTWQTPLVKSISSTTNIPAGAGTLKRFFKFNKSMRFRVAHFQLNLQTDGSSTEGPNRIYWLTLFLAPHETAVKSVS